MQKYFAIGLNTIYQILGRLVTAIVTFFITRVVTQSLGLEGYGQYQMIISYVTIFWILTDFGLNNVAVREMSESEKKFQPYFSSLLTLRLLLGIVLTVLCVVILPFLNYPSVVQIGILITAATILFQGPMGATHAVFQTKLRFDQQFLANTIGGLVLFFGVILSVKLNLGVAGLSVAFLLGYLVMSSASLFWASKWALLKIQKDKKHLYSLFKESFLFGIALLFSLGAFKVDAILLSLRPLPFLSNSGTVGIYNLAYKVFELALVVPLFFMNVMYPILVKHLQEGTAKFLITARKALFALLISSFVSASFIYFTAPYLIRILARSEGFETSVDILRSLAAFIPVFHLTALFMFTLIVLKKQKLLVLVYGASFIFNFAANWLLIPQYSFFASALITGVSETLVLVLLVSLVMREWSKVRISNGGKIEAGDARSL